MRNSGGVRNARNNSSGYSSSLNLLAESGWVERNGKGLGFHFQSKSYPSLHFQGKEHVWGENCQENMCFVHRMEGMFIANILPLQ